MFGISGVSVVFGVFGVSFIADLLLHARVVGASNNNTEIKATN